MVTVETVARAIADEINRRYPRCTWEDWKAEARAVLATPQIATAIELAEAHLAYRGCPGFDLLIHDRYVAAVAAYREARR